MKKLYLFFICGSLFTTTVCAQPWEIGWPVAANVIATLSGGTLIISGTGAMEDFVTDNDQPWKSQRNTITSVVINQGVTNIGNIAFAVFRSLEQITIPNSLETIGTLSFNGCTDLTSITIPTSVSHICNSAFIGCTAMTSFAVDPQNATYSSEDGILFNKNKTTLVSYPAGKQGNYTIPNSVETIDVSAFYSSGIHILTISGNVLKSIKSQSFSYCNNLTSITLPLSVEFIGSCAFQNSMKLVEIVNYATTPIEIENNVFTGVDMNTCILRVPAASVKAYKEADVWKDFKNIEPIDDITWQIVDGTLTISGTGDMKNYTNQNDRPWASQINSITSLVIGEGVTSIGDNAFMNSGIHSVTITGNTLKKIGSQAFASCSNLTSINLPASVETIDIAAFVMCTSMTSIEVDPDNTAFSSIDDVLFNKNITELFAFPSGIQGSYTVPASVETIRAGAFCGSSIHSVVFLGNALKTIEYMSFVAATNLTSITLPASVEFIGSQAFYFCYNLKEIVNLSATPLVISYIEFYGINFDECLLRVPAGSVDAYQQAEGWKLFQNIVPLEAGISVDKADIYLLAGATTEITATITGTEIVEWKTDNPTVATVNTTGTLTAVSAGTTVITASSGSAEASCSVIVIQPKKSNIARRSRFAGH